MSVPLGVQRIREEQCKKASCTYNLDYSNPCVFCPAGHFGRYESKGCQELPSLVSMVVYAVDAGLAHLDNGIKTRTAEEVEHILTTYCKPCPYYIKASGRCSQCGCWLKTKASFALEHCPLNFW